MLLGEAVSTADEQSDYQQHTSHQQKQPGQSTYRVQFVFTGARQRMLNILDAAKQLQPPTGFCPFCGLHLDDYAARHAQVVK